MGVPLNHASSIVMCLSHTKPIDIFLRSNLSEFSRPVLTSSSKDDT